MAESLRERSRARRRAEIERAAMRLFAERGYDSTTVAQVAEAAEVSPRTVSLYFPSKLELALSYVAASARRLSEACGNRSADQTTLDVLAGWLQDERETHGETIGLLRAMLDTNPALRGAETPEVAESKRNVNEALAADLGRSPDDAVVRLVNGAMAGVISALLQISPKEDGAAEAFDVAKRLFESVIDSAHARKGEATRARTAG
jgi:AcrR family transcriptional regulator